MINANGDIRKRVLEMFHKASDVKESSSSSNTLNY